MLLGRRKNARKVEHSGPLSSACLVEGGRRSGCFPGEATFPSLPGQLKSSSVQNDSNAFPLCGAQSFEKKSPSIQSNSQQKYGKKVERSLPLGISRSSSSCSFPAVGWQDMTLSHHGKMHPAFAFDEQDSTLDLIADSTIQKEEMFLDECYALLMETDHRNSRQGLECCVL